jgi:hypothetical protein
MENERRLGISDQTMECSEGTEKVALDAFHRYLRGGDGIGKKKWGPSTASSC